MRSYASASNGSGPDAIEHEAREKLHYAKPGEVIYTLPAASPAQPQPAATGK
jgi:cell division protein FtsB